MFPGFRINPRGGVAEALTGVFAPNPVGSNGAGRADCGFSAFGGPAELAASALRKLTGEQLPPRLPGAVREAHPGKMEDLMDQNPGHLAGFLPQGLVQDDAALPDEAGRVDLLAVPFSGAQTPPDRAQSWRPLNANGGSQ